MPRSDQLPAATSFRQDGGGGYVPTATGGQFLDADSNVVAYHDADGLKAINTPRVLETDTTYAENTTTSAEILATATIPANTLLHDGDAVEVRFDLAFIDSTLFIVLVNGTGWELTDQPQFDSGQATCVATIIRTSSTAAKMTMQVSASVPDINGYVSPAFSVAFDNLTGLSWTSAVTVSLQVTGLSASAVGISFMRSIFYPAV